MKVLKTSLVLKLLLDDGWEIVIREEAIDS